MTIIIFVIKSWHPPWTDRFTFGVWSLWRENICKWGAVI